MTNHAVRSEASDVRAAEMWCTETAAAEVTFDPHVPGTLDHVTCRACLNAIFEFGMTAARRIAAINRETPDLAQSKRCGPGGSFVSPWRFR